MKERLKLSKNILCDKFHRSDGAMATIKDHNLWYDVHITSGNDSVCISCNIMIIPTISRGKLRSVSPTFPLEEAQINTVTNLEPQGISVEPRCTYFLILFGKFSRIFTGI